MEFAQFKRRLGLVFDGLTMKGLQLAELQMKFISGWEGV